MVRADRLPAPAPIVVQNGGRREPHQDLEFNTRDYAGANLAARVQYMASPRDFAIGRKWGGDNRRSECVLQGRFGESLLQPAAGSAQQPGGVSVTGARGNRPAAADARREWAGSRA